MGLDDEYGHALGPPEVDPADIADTGPMIELPCGCKIPTDLDHTTGDRLRQCKGGGLRITRVEPGTGIGEDHDLARETCPGGRAYVIHAEPQPPRYFASPAPASVVTKVQAIQG